MAKNYSEIYSAVYDKKNKMDFSNSMIRGNGIPLDITEVYNSLNAAISYAASNPVAYEGQLLAVTENGDTNVYVIGPKSQGTVTINGKEVVNYLKLVGKETDLSNYYTKEQVDALIPEVPEIPAIEIVDDTEAEVPEEAFVNVYKNLTSDGHKLTEELVQVATTAGLNKVKEDLEKKITAGMSFKGAIDALPLSAELGDTYKVYGENITIEIDGVKAKAGDTVIYGVDDESLSTYKWYLIPSGDDIEDTWRPVTGVGADKSLTFNAGEKIEVKVDNNGNITYSHKAIDTPAVSAGEGRTYITEVETDGHGHITGYKVATETDQVIPEDTNTTYDLSAEFTEGKVDIKLASSEPDDVDDVISIIAGENITISKTDADEIKITATNSTYTAGQGLKLSSGEFSVAIPEDGHVVINDEGEVTVGELPVYETVQDENGKDVKQLATPGTGIFKDVYTKEETDDAIVEAVKMATGGESASAVLAELTSYKKANDERVGEVEERVQALENLNADDNVIEIIKLAGTALTVTDKAVDIPAASQQAYGVVKLSQEIGVNAAGALEVSTLNTNKLVQTPGEWLILNGGTASI